MISVAVFWLLAAVTIGSACITAFSRNIVYSTFALFGSFAGVAGIYILLGADFLFIIQIFIYIGGILVVTIFAVMLTQGVADINVSNRMVGTIPAAVVSIAAAAVMLYALERTHWPQGKAATLAPTTAGIGEAFLGAYVLPFEVASIVLLAALIGAIVISRQETRG